MPVQIKSARKSMRFASVRYLQRRKMLDLTFENGDHYVIPTESVLPATNHVQIRPNGKRDLNHTAGHKPPDWSKMRISEMGDVLEVPAVGSVIEIPWDHIRRIADAKFGAQWADKAARWRSAIGKRLRTMRLEAGLTRPALASKLGVPRETVADVESGKTSPPTELIEQIAAALGNRLADFAKK
jgi:DNA-binding XRE family transcriptional regulator